eukprot:jgi/Hompol1/6135/HPOL_000504-RA
MLKSMTNIRSLEAKLFEQQKRLFEGAASLAVVADVCRYLSPESYKEIIAERTAEGICGYPACDQELKRQVYDISQLKSFCCSECYAASELLQSQLSSDPLYMRSTESSATINLVPARTKIE